MQIVYLSNYFNHHQKPLADSLFTMLGDDYHFVSTEEFPEFRKNLGYKEITAPYVIRYCKETKDEIDKMIMSADVVIYGEAPISIIKHRII